jgi:hypothetical protein
MGPPPTPPSMKRYRQGENVIPSPVRHVFAYVRRIASVGRLRHPQNRIFERLHLVCGTRQLAQLVVLIITVRYRRMRQFTALNWNTGKRVYRIYRICSIVGVLLLTCLAIGSIKTRGDDEMVKIMLAVWASIVPFVKSGISSCLNVMVRDVVVRIITVMCRKARQFTALNWNTGHRIILRFGVGKRL